VVLDVHTHVFPERLGALTRHGAHPERPVLDLAGDGSGRIMRDGAVFRSVHRSCFDLVARTDALDAAGVDAHCLMPVPVCFTTGTDPVVARDWTRAHNDALAEAVAAAPDPSRFPWLGLLPLPDVDAAVAELERGVRDLGMLGAEIPTELGDVDLDDPRLDGLWSAAESLGVAVFIHPADGGAGAIRRRGVPEDFALGMTTATAMAASALVFGGVLERHPRLRVGLAHGCGTFPFAFPRLARGALLRAPGAPGPRSLPEADVLARRLWADALVFDPRHLPLLVERFGADHVMLGSDFPFYPPVFGDPLAMLDEAESKGLCGPASVADIRGANARRFLGLT
jgi:aminocarboxymuconate-semialdehyde decarboxylase